MCLMRIGPDRVPTAAVFVVPVVIINLFLQYLLVATNGALTMSTLNTISWAVVGTTLFAFNVWALLALAKKAHRATATIAALFGCEIILLLLLLPGQLVTSWYAQNPEQFNNLGGFLVALAGLSSLVVRVYQIILFSSIMQKAFDTSFTQGCALTILAMLVSILGTILLLPFPEITIPNMQEL